MHIAPENIGWIIAGVILFANILIQAFRPDWAKKLLGGIGGDAGGGGDGCGGDGGCH